MHPRSLARVRSGTLALLAAVIAPATATAQIWNSYLDFPPNASTQLPYRNWSYASFAPETDPYQAMQVEVAGTPPNTWLQVQINATVPFPVFQQERQVPDGMRDAVRIWTAPQSGLVQITSHSNVRLMGFPPTSGGTIPPPGPTADGVALRILRNHLVLWERDIPATPYDPVGFPLNLSVRVNAGDQLRFACNAKSGIVDDWVVFLPIITLTPGTGYTNTQQSFSSLANFAAAHPNWRYLSIGRTTGPSPLSAYTALTLQTAPGAQSATSRWYTRVVGGQTTWCVVEADRQVPDAGHDSVRAWQATAEGDAYIRTVVPFARSYTSSGAIDDAIVHVDHNATRLGTIVLAPNNTTGEHFTRRIHVQANDCIFVRVSAGPAGNITGDHVNTQVAVDFVPTTRLSTQFSGPITPAGWSFQGRAKTGGTTTAMAYSAGPPARWSLTAPNAGCRIEADRQGATATHDSDRVWTMSADCQLHVDSLSNLTWSTTGGSGPLSEYQIWRVRTGEPDLLVWARQVPWTGAGVTCNARVNVRQGDQVRLRLSHTSTAANLPLLITPLRLTRFTQSAPPIWEAPIIQKRHPSIPGGPVTIGLGTNETWTWGRYQVTGDLEVQGGSLRIVDSILEMMCTKHREHEIVVSNSPLNPARPGSFETSNVLFGGTKNSSGTIFASNMTIKKADWFAVDTTARYLYGQAIGEYIRPGDPLPIPGTTMRALRHKLGEYGEGILTNRTGDIALRDSSIPIWLGMEPPAVGPSSWTLDLHNGIRANDVFDATNVPGAAYSILLTNSTVPHWNVALGDISNNTPPMTLTLKNATSLSPAIGTSLRGGFNKPTAQLGSTTTMQTGPVTWVFQNCNVPIGGMYAGMNAENPPVPGHLVHYGAAALPEFMLFEGTMYVVGDEAPAGRPTLNATTIEVGYPDFSSPTNSRKMVIQRANIGPDSPSTPGEINIRAGSTLFLEDCDLKNLTIKQDAGGTFQWCNCTTSNVTVIGPTPPPLPTNTRRQALHEWQWNSGGPEWLNWDYPGSGSTNLGFQSPVFPVSNGELVLEYANPPVGGFQPRFGNPAFEPRIVAPVNAPGSSIFMGEGRCLRAQDLYLVIKYRTAIQPGHGNPDGKIQLLLSTRSKREGWTGFTKYDRYLELPMSATSQTRRWHLNTPGRHTTNPNLSAVTFPTGWDRLPDDADYLAISFGTFAHDAGLMSNGDFLYIDEIVITANIEGY